MLKIYYHGTMLTDYFGGSNFPAIFVPVDKNSTYKEVYSNLEAETQNLWDHIEYTLKFEGYKGDIEKDVESALNEVKEVISRIKQPLFNQFLEYTFEELEEYEDYSQAIFTIEISED